MIYYSSYSQIPSVTDSVKLFAPYNSYPKQIIDYLELDYLPIVPFQRYFRYVMNTQEEIPYILHSMQVLRTSCQLLVTIPAFPARAQEQAFSGRNGKPCHLGSARSGRHARSLRPTQNIKDLGK